MTQIQRGGFAAIVLILFLGSLLSAGSLREKKRVLAIYSEDKAHPAHELTDRGLRESFQSNKLFDVQLYTEYLDLTQFSDTAHLRTLADYLQRKYAGTKIDVIIGVYPAAVDVLLGEAQTAFPGVPIVACEVSRPYSENLGDSPSCAFMTGVVMATDVAGLLDTALRLLPGTKSVALIAGTTPNDGYSEQVFRDVLEHHAGKLELNDLTKLPMSQILARVGSLPPDSIVLYSGILEDGEGRSFVPRDALSMISRASNAPVFGIYDTYMGYGVVGGSLVSFERQGMEAAKLALRILGGESPASIPFAGDQAYASLYDWRELKRWNIPENAVPPGSEILYRQQSLWEQHKVLIIGVAALVVLETTLIFSLVTNLLHRRKAERSLVESEELVRLAVSSAGTGLWSLDSGTGSIWVSDKTRELLGIALDEELTLEKFFGVILPEDRESVRLAVKETLQGEKESPIEYRVGHPDGTVRWIVSRGRLQKRTAWDSIRLMGVSVDVTPRKKAEFADLKHREDLARVSHLASISELSAALAHQINQPLSAILSNAQAAARYLTRKPPNLDEMSEMLSDIIKDNERASDVIRRLRALFRTGTVDFNSIDLNQVVREAAGFAKDSEKLNRVSIVTDLEEGLPLVEGDMLHLEQVILNLVYNGVEAMEVSQIEHCVIRISTEKYDEDCVKVSIQDKGPGIDETTKDQMFQAFQSSKPDGMGMGLSICRSIIEAHGGRIWAENCPECSGAIFSFTVPKRTRRVR